LPSVKTSGIFDGGDGSDEFDVDGANIIFIPLFFKVFKSIVYDGGIVGCCCWGSGWIKHGIGSVNVVVWGENKCEFEVSIGLDLSDDDKSSDGFNLERFIGRFPVDISVDWLSIDVFARFFSLIIINTYNIIII